MTIDNLPKSVDPFTSFSQTLRTKPLNSIGINHMERNERVHEMHIVSLLPSSLVHLESSSYRANIFTSARVRWTGNTRDAGAVQQIQGNDASTSSCRQPGKQEHMRVEQGLTSLPAIRRRRMHVEIPQETNMNGRFVTLSISPELFNIKSGRQHSTPTFDAPPTIPLFARPTSTTIPRSSRSRSLPIPNTLPFPQSLPYGPHTPPHLEKPLLTSFRRLLLSVRLTHPLLRRRSLRCTL